jgi:F0F1-type ATP synthase membrane subunit c/vacuolar-type H+-ATPase subunit K
VKRFTPWRIPLIAGAAPWDARGEEEDAVATAQVDPEQARRNNWVLWACLLMSQVIYAGIAATRVVPTSPSVPAMSMALAVVAFATAVGAHLCWRRSRGAGRAAHEPRPAQQIAFTFFLLACVLDESIGIYGLVLAFLGAPLATWAPFTAASIALLLIHRPA